MGKFRTLFSSWNGRIGRAQFWLGVLVVVIFTLVASGLLFLLGQGVTSTATRTVQVNGGAASTFERTQFTLNPVAGLFVSLINAALMLTIGIKRRHDRDFSGIDLVAFVALSLLSQIFISLGWLSGAFGATLSVVLFVWGICLFILLGILKGTSGPNRYGPDPLAPAT